MAFTEDEILTLVNGVVDKAKPFINKAGNRTALVEKNEKGLLPEYYQGYNKKVNEFEDILVHSMEGIFPGKIFSESAPNQEPQEFEYIKRNYRNTTLPIFADYISTVSLPFHKSNWSINYIKDDDLFKNVTLQKYLESGLPTYFSLENFMKNVVPTIKARDAEGVIAVKPKEVPVTENEEGEMVISPTELIDPIPAYYSVKQRVTEAESHVMVEIKEKSPVTDGKTIRNVGFIFEFYDEESIWRITQVGRRIDYTFEVELFFKHNWGTVPVYKLMGIPHAEDDAVTYQSPFLFAVPNLDLVTIYQSDLQSSIKKVAFPYRIMIGDICEFTDVDGNQCANGQLSIYDDALDQTISKSCPDCGGSGLKSRISRLGEMLIRPETSIAEGETKMTMDPLQYVSPKVDTLEFMRAEIHEHESRGRRILHLNTTNDKAQPKEDALATSKQLDDKARASFVSPISGQMFFLYGNILDAMGWMRYGDSYKKPELNEPTTFDFSTEKDYIERISMATEAGAPPAVVRAILMQFIQTIYVNDERQEKVFRLIANADRLLPISAEEVALKIARGTAAKWEDVLHCSAMTLVSELMEENENFLALPFAEQKKNLIDKAKENVTEVSPDPTPIIIGS